jgi:hypothetical protein
MDYLILEKQVSALNTHIFYMNIQFKEKGVLCTLKVLLQ